MMSNMALETETSRRDHELNLLRDEDRRTLYEFLATRHQKIDPAAIEFALSRFAEHWLVGQWPPMLSLWVSASGSWHIPFDIWIRTITSVYGMRNAEGIEEQIRRLGLRSHEHLDTELVIRIASKYHRAGFEVAFEPNKEGCSDFSIRGRGLHLYSEVKRENRTEHKRVKSIMTASQAVQTAALEIIRWLEDRSLRAEIWFSRSFPENVAKTIVREITTSIYRLEIRREQEINALPGSRYVLIPRSDPEFYTSAIRSAQIEIKQTGVPVQLAVQNMPIVVAFDPKPNLSALMKRVRKAGKQLRNDGLKDPSAQGFIVAETSHGELAQGEIAKNFENLPLNCLGVIVLSNVSAVLARENVTTEILEVLSIAGETSM